MEYSLLLMCLCLFSVNCEPECSRFHYEQMTLEKMIRQELNVEKMLGEYRDELQRMKNEINDLRSESENYKTELDFLRSKAVKYQSALDSVNETTEKMRDEFEDEFQQMRREIAELKNETKKYQSALDERNEVKRTAREVIFHTKTLKNTSPSSGERLVFEEAITNIGDGYSTSDGRFTAPVNGTYAFTVQLCMDAGAGYIHYGFVKSTGEVLVRSQLGKTGTHYYDCDALSIFETLNTGESVWVENRQNSKNYKEIPNQFWNYFSGVLLKNK